MVTEIFKFHRKCRDNTMQGENQILQMRCIFRYAWMYSAVLRCKYYALNHAVLISYILVLHCTKLFRPLNSLYCTIPHCSDTLIPCIARYHAILIPYFLKLNCDTLIWPVNACASLYHAVLAHKCLYSTVPRCSDPSIPWTALYHAVLAP